jgi:GT2 family glycosyltransferase
MDFSVIIPNFNQADVLSKTLRSLADQSDKSSILEVFVVDDGSSDHSVELVRNLVGDLPYPLHLLQQEHQGPAAARNRGAAASNGEVLLFWDSDMIAHSQMVQTHAQLHKQYDRLIVAGARQPWEAAYTSSFGKAMKLHKFGKNQFHSRQPSFWEAFSSNLSLHREDFVELDGFDERFWAFEDTDLAYRAKQAGLSLIFARRAIGYHNHPMTLEQVCQQQRRYQRYAALFLDKHSELRGKIPYLVDKAPIRWGDDPKALVVRKAIRRLIATRPVLKVLRIFVSCIEDICPRPNLLRFLYWKIIASYQLIGYREGLRMVGTDNERD